MGVVCLAEQEKDREIVRNSSNYRMAVTIQSQTEELGPTSQGGRRADKAP